MLVSDGVPATVVLIQLPMPDAGRVETITSPLESTATHSEVEGHDSRTPVAEASVPAVRHTHGNGEEAALAGVRATTARTTATASRSLIRA